MATVVVPEQLTRRWSSASYRSHVGEFGLRIFVLTCYLLDTVHVIHNKKRNRVLWIKEENRFGSCKITLELNYHDSKICKLADNMAHSLHLTLVVSPS